MVSHGIGTNVLTIVAERGTIIIETLYWYEPERMFQLRILLQIFFFFFNFSSIFTIFFYNFNFINIHARAIMYFDKLQLQISYLLQIMNYKL